MNRVDLYDPLWGEDKAFMVDILKMHPDYEKKIGAGLSYIYVDITKEFRKRGFFIKRVDLTTIDFSFLKSISGKHKTTEEDFKAACRRAIMQDIVSFKNNHIVHHEEPSFNDIVNNFLEETGIIIDNIKYTQGVTTEFTDLYLKQKFIDYHRKVAILAMVLKEEHKDIHRKNT